VQRFLYDLTHTRQIVFGGQFAERAFAHHVHAQRRMADVGAVVDALGQALHVGEIFSKGLPLPVDAFDHRRGGNVLDRLETAREPLALIGLARRQRKATVAHEDAGDTVPARTCAHRIPGHLRVHVGVPVNEAGRDDQSVGVDGACRGLIDSSDFGDAPGADADIGLIARRTAAVDHRAVLDQ